MDIKLPVRLHSYRDWVRLKTLCTKKYSDRGQRLKQRNWQNYFTRNFLMCILSQTWLYLWN